MSSPPVLTLTSCVVHLDTQRVVRENETTVLTGQEAGLLAYLAERQGETVSRDALFTDVLGYADGTRSRALDAAIRRLRHKIEADPADPVHLLTMHGEGYRLHLARPDTPATASVPRYDNAFVGRAAAASQLSAWVQVHPLVTLHGPGGVGKTRLACEALAGRDDVSVVTVAPGADLGSVAADVAVGLALPVTGETAASAAVGFALAARHGVLVLDGAEVAVEAVAALVTGWMRDHPAIRLVVTSREPLAVPGERVLPVEPLDTEDGVALLRTRASAALGGRPWVGDDEDVLSRLTSALDGLPLALELAASRAPILTAPELLARLDDRFALLRRTRRGGPAHHATLDATLGWSWDLLDADERSVLVQLSVLTGPFRFEAAEGIARPPDGGDALDVVGRLTAKSLLRPVDATGCLRMLDSVRAFARARAAQPPFDEVEAAAKTRLAEIAHRLPLAPVDRLEGARRALHLQLPSASWAVRAALEVVPDLRDGVDLIERARARLTGDELLELGLAACATLTRAASADVLDAWLDTLAAAEPSDPSWQPELHGVVGQLLLARGHFADALKRLEHAAEQTQGPAQVEVLLPMGVTLLRRGEPDRARDVLAEARAASIRGSGPWARATVLLALAVREADADLDASEALLTEAMGAQRALGLTRDAAIAQSNLANLRYRQGRLADGIALGEAAVATLERSGDLRALAQVRQNVAVLQDQIGRGEASMEGFRQVIRLAEQLGDRASWALAQANLALRLARTSGGPEAAPRVAEATQRVSEALIAADAMGARPLATMIAMFQGRILAAAGDPSGVEAALNRAVAWIADGTDPELQAEVYLSRAELRASADPVQATADLAHAEELLARLGDRGVLRAAWELAAARVTRAGGRTQAALHQVRAARRRLEALGVEDGSYLLTAAQTLEAELLTGAEADTEAVTRSGD